VNKDLFNRELHLASTQEAVKAFANDKTQRAFVVAKIEKSTTGQDSTNTSTVKSEKPTSEDMSEGISRNETMGGASQVELVFSNKVEYIGHTAQTIAFLKRENYSRLDLKVELDLTKLLEDQESVDGTNNEADKIDLSHQLQIVNLGYLGQESNIFELASTYVDFSFLPLFHDYNNKTSGSNAASSGPDTTGSADGLKGILKDLSSLKLNLAQCRQNLDIPMVELSCDPVIKEKITEHEKTGTPPDFEPLIHD